jgi:biotin carboxyl carrier protein
MNSNNFLYTAVFETDPAAELDISQEDLHSADIVRISEDTMQMILGQKNYLVQILHSDYASKKFLLRINGKEISVKLRDDVEARVHAMGFDLNRNHIKLKQITSPMPGLVLKVLVQEGESIHEGGPVIILEAMKMENVLNAPADGIVARLHVREKQNVEKNQLLVELS